MAADLDSLLPAIPEPSHALCRALWEEGLASPAALRMEVRAWQSRMHTVVEHRDLLDPELGDRLATCCMRLLRWLDRPDTPEHRLVHLACRYLACDDDGEADFDSVLGLDDDAAVINAVVEAIGHPEWRVELP
jgi:hypothetical protein